MRLLLLFCLAVLLALPARYIRAQSASAFPDPGSLAHELHRLETSARNGRSREILDSLPPSWVVVAAGRRYSISTAPLRKFARSPAEAQRWLDQLARQLESYSTASGTAVSASAARTQLDHVLSRREFAAVRPPTLWQRLLQRVFDWIAGILRSLVDYAKQHPTSGMILFWLVAAVAVGFLGFWLLHLWSHKSRAPLSQPAGPALEWTWQQWAILAREASDRGDRRGAIHCAYWAGVVRLQDMQLLPRDLARTPREYLNLLPDSESSRVPLAALTSALERFWYAARNVSPEDLHESFAQMEALGCRLG